MCVAKYLPKDSNNKMTDLCGRYIIYVDIMEESNTVITEIENDR